MSKLWNWYHTYLSKYQFYKGSALQNLNGQWPFLFMVGIPSPVKIGSNRSCGRADITLHFFSCDFTRLQSHRVMWLHRWLVVTLCHHPAKSGGINFVEEKILQFDTWTPVIGVMQLHYGLRFTICQHPVRFVNHIWFLVCHVTNDSCYQVVRGTCDFLVSFTSP